ncbi:MAG: YggS family pyridoxal phosphate-dependent enzyme [Anaerolineae bacterium]|nr:YggS family pyridoxal phosphate-dependent enzyme [Anaerolineae bacterium]
MMIAEIEANLQSVRERIAAAAGRAGRDAAEIMLVAVTKTQPVEVIRAAYELGLRDFGENRVEEAESKFHRLPEDIRWHMVGHVQSRKAAQAVRPYVLVHSVDSLKLARRLDRFAAEAGRRLPILLEVNVSGEASKYGLRPEEVAATVEAMRGFAHLQLQGLMTMAPIVPDPEDARPVFAALRELRGRLAVRFPDLDRQHLSMGMSDDFEVAVEEGATILRIGRAIFGERR